MSALRFEVLARSGTCEARVGRVTTLHGSFDTPAFMPVGTAGSVKGLLPEQVAQTGSQIILANTYHLMLRPGAQLVAQMGGLHGWMRWDRPILTDSGGYQVFSLAQIRRLHDEGVEFKSHIDGATIGLTPEAAIQVQNQLGADIIMPLDDCPPAAAEGLGGGAAGSEPRIEETVVSEAVYPRLQQACERTVRWLGRCVRAHERRRDQALFGIVQGGIDLRLRSWCVQRVIEYDLPGYAIGGVAVGEGFDQVRSVVEHTAPLLPADRPRYLMGVGYERDLLVAVRAGVDMFDCVLPTRNGRNALAFTSGGPIRLRNARYADDARVIEPGCDCVACGSVGGRAGFSRGYLRHLFMAGEMLGPVLVSAHNIRHFQRYMLDIRRAIIENDWSLIERNWPVVRSWLEGSGASVRRRC